MKTDSLTQRLARNLDVIRTARRWSVEDFARNTGLTRQLVSLWRTGTHSASLPVVERTASRLGVDPCDLLSADLGEVLKEATYGERVGGSA